MPAEVLVGATTSPSVQITKIGGGLSGPAAASTTGIVSTPTSEADTHNRNNSAVLTQNNSNNTISAAADSSDNQPGTPQPQLTNNNSTESMQNSSSNQHAYANHQIYGSAQQSTATSNPNPLLNHMYSGNVYSSSNMDLQQRQMQQHLSSTQNPASYPSFLNSYEQFYQQQQQQNPADPSPQNQNPQQMDLINSNSNPLFSSVNPSEDYKQLRYHPYLHHSTSGVPALNSQNSNSNNAMDTNAQAAPVVSAASSSVMSPRVVSSTSPSSASNQMQMTGSATSIGSSPHSAGSLQCKKCGIMCTNDSELQEHIANVHGASPYGSSGYASSPYVKDEMQQKTPPSQNQQQQQQPPSAQPAAAQGVNPGEILDLDSQKLLYPAAAGSMPGMMHANLGNATTDPLHGLHSMQQRAGINTWDQQSQEGLPHYLQQQSSETKNSFYQSPKQSPYHINSNSSNIIKAEYQAIKTEYAGDTQSYVNDKSFDPTTTNQQQQMMAPAVSSSPAEFPTTTTGGPQDNQQQNVANNPQFRGGNFEPPSSSSANISTGPIGTKAANWKSNEPRRPKTYNCTACNKWFTSSGHLKRHYNTTLHKNAVKSSGQPDPATLPISAHHHPARDPTGKTGRGRGSNAAANSAINNAQQQQQPPNPVQPPEPPNSPQGYGGSQVAAVGLPSMTHYTAIPSPTNLYEHQQYQYVPQQVQSSTNSSPQQASPMGDMLQNRHQPHTVSNGHPNALAGLSVPTTVYQQQAPMPSSQMRGLLNTMPLLTVKKAFHITKIEHSEAATMENPPQATHAKQGDEYAYLTKASVKEELSEEVGEKCHQYQRKLTIYSPKGAEQKSEGGIIQQHLQSTPATMDAEHHLNVTSQQIPHYQVAPAPQEGTQTYFHSTTPTHSNTIPNSTPIQLHHIICPDQQQQQQDHQMVLPDTYTLIQTPSSTMAPQYISMHSATNMPPNSMLQLQPQLTTMERQPLPPATTIPTTNIVSIQPLSHHLMQPLPLQHMELQRPANTLQQLDTISTNMPSHHTPTSNTISTQSFHQLQRLDSVLPQLDHMQTSPPTTIGNADFLPAAVDDNLNTSGGDFRYFQILRADQAGTTVKSNPIMCYSELLYAAEKSPLAGDMPHDTVLYKQNNISPALPSPNDAGKELFDVHMDEQPSTSHAAARNNKRRLVKKRSRNSSSSSGSVAPNSEILPSGRIRCIPCDKEFTKVCYLTQHNNSFHSGEYPYRCEKCGKRYQEEPVYLCHLSKHNATEKDHKCETCPKQFHHKTDLGRHITSSHTKAKPHSCEICGKSFCRKDHLRKHIETHNRPRAVAKKRKQSAAAAGTGKPRKKRAKLSPASTSNESSESFEAAASSTSTSPSLLQPNENVPADHSGFLYESGATDLTASPYDPQQQRGVQSLYNYNNYVVIEM